MSFGLAYASYCGWYRTAARHLAAGDLGVRFPPGSLPPPRPLETRGLFAMSARRLEPGGDAADRREDGPGELLVFGVDRAALAARSEPRERLDLDV